MGTIVANVGLVYQVGVLVTVWSGILYFILRSKFPTKNEVYTREEIQTKFYTKEEVHNVFVSEKTHDFKLDSLKENLNLNVDSLRKELVDIKKLLQRFLELKKD